MSATTPLMAIGALVSIVIAVWALIDLWRSPNSLGAKLWWTFGIIIIPIIIGVAYLITRPGGKLQQEAYEVHDEEPDTIHGRDEYRKPGQNYGG
ncbi:MAG: hypothetical protein ACR2N2_03035 [Acidimicrobiia bacterium]